MGSVTFQAGQKADCQRLSSSTVVSVDIGFSQNSKSTGIAWRTSDGDHSAPAKFTFAQGVETVAHRLGQDTTASLILEAPLSAQFNVDGNPAPRLDFERIFDVQKQKSVNRFWYVGAGASTLIAAMFFLRRLINMLAKSEADHRVFLFEGLHTFKYGPTDHAQDAADLLQAFCDGDVVDVTKGAATEWLSVLQLIDSESNTAIPAIVTVNRESTELETNESETD